MRARITLEMSKDEIFNDYKSYLEDETCKEDLLEHGFVGLKNLTVDSILQDSAYLQTVFEHLISLDPGSLGGQVGENFSIDMELKVGKKESNC